MVRYKIRKNNWYRRILPLLMLSSLMASTEATAAGATVAAGDERATERNCPAGLNEHATCYGGRDRNGAYFLVALPKIPNGALVVHAHGGPRHINPDPHGSDEDLARFAVMVRSGYAWIGTTYRTGGYGVRLAADDVDNSRRIYWKLFGRPRQTILHGQSYGGNVAAKLVELAALGEDGKAHYDGVLLTSAAVGKRIETYDALFNLRAVYQYFCRNLPRPDEEQYPAWWGLPKQSQMSREEVRKRVNDCTGVDQPSTVRTPEKSNNLKAILGATGISEKQLLPMMELTVVRFQDVVHNFLGSINPFDNSKTVYQGSGQDVALNHGVSRFVGSKKARDLLAYDSDVRGTILIPTITLHAKFDPVVNYRGQLHYQNVVAQAGQSHRLLQLLTSENQHSKLSDNHYMAALSALASWIDSQIRPDFASIERVCYELASTNQQPCSFIAPKER